MNRILLLEDDLSLIDGLKYTLEKNGFSLDIARTVEQAFACLRSPESYDLLLLDVALPDGTGWEVCSRVRAGGNPVPIIFLTAADEEVHIIRGLDSGGDDYITKPFKLGELVSRIRALLRRAGMAQSSQPQEAACLQCGDLLIDYTHAQASLQGHILDLTAVEYRLLCLLARNAGQIVPRSRILEELWDQDSHFVDDNTLSVYIRRLREKTESDPSHPVHLITIRGFGYRWNEVSL